MKILKLNIFFGLILVFSFQASTVFACHEGGPMGFASEDPLASTIDYSSGSTFIFASTFGTLGCKNWDFVKNNRVQYLVIIVYLHQVKVNNFKAYYFPIRPDTINIMGFKR